MWVKVLDQELYYFTIDAISNLSSQAWIMSDQCDIQLRAEGVHAWH